MVMSSCLYISIQMYQSIFTLYLKERGASFVEIGLTASIYSSSTILTRFVAGPLSSRLGSKPFMLSSLTGLPIALVLYAFAPSVVWIYPIQILTAVSVASFNPIAMSLVLHLAPLERRGDIVGRFLTSIGASTLVGPMISSLLLDLFDMSYQNIFLLALFPVLTGFLVFMLTTKKGSASSELFEEVQKETQTTNRVTGFAENFRGIFTSRAVILLNLSRLVFAFTLAFFRTLSPLYLVNELGAAPAAVPLLFTFYGFLNTLTRIPTGRLISGIRKKKLFLSGILLIVSICFLGISLTKDYGLLALFAALYGGCHGARAVVEWTLLGENVAPRLRGLANAYFENMFDTGSAVGELTAGVLASFLPIPTVFQIASTTILLDALTLVV